MATSEGACVYMCVRECMLRPTSAHRSSCVCLVQISPVVIQAETARHICFNFTIGKHSLKFNPKEHKDELSLHYISLPMATLTGAVKSGRRNRLPRVSVELAVKQVNIDLSTDMLNQLLILQNTFIKVCGVKDIHIVSGNTFGIGEYRWTGNFRGHESFTVFAVCKNKI